MENTAEYIEMIINNRCLDRDYPHLSDLLGSDWGVGTLLGYESPQEYQEKAVALAYRRYPSMWKS